MRYAVVFVALAANVLAAPAVKRDVEVVTDTNVVYATDVVTVVESDSETVTATASSAETQGHWGNHGGWSGSGWQWTSQAAESTSSTSTQAPAPAPTTPTSTYVPPPAPTTTSTTPVSTTQAPAPTTPSTTSTTAAAPSTSDTWAAPSSASSWGGQTTGLPVTTTTVGSLVSWTETAAYTGYSQVAQDHHNFHRANNSSPDLKWNATLAKSAADIANTCKYEHNMDMDGGGYGQNIAAGVDMNNISTIITDMFYNGEVGWYDGLYQQGQPDMTNFEHWGHFSQIVWGNTTSFACATSNCTAQGLQNVGSDTAPYFTVCNYYPAGNVEGEYGGNIRKGNAASAGWDSAY